MICKSSLVCFEDTVQVLQVREDPQEAEEASSLAQWDATHAGWNSPVQEEPLQYLMWTEF